MARPARNGLQRDVFSRVSRPRQHPKEIRLAKRQANRQDRRQAAAELREQDPR